MTSRLSFGSLASIFLAATLFLTYLWWDTVDHLLLLILHVDAFSHGQLVPFISAWLIWSQRDKIKQAEVFLWAPGIIVLFGAALLWLIGEILELRLSSHIAYVTGLQGLALTIFGPNLYQRFLFPFLFLYMAIPVGHSLIPIMQDLTARLSVGLLGIVGVPYELDGILITLSSGVYEVARACAGVRFLFTSVVTGVLLAYLVYSQWKKRLLIILAAGIIPIFANVLRVFGIFIISEATDQTFAKDVDHIVYGWGFLTAILLILIAVAYKFADEDRDVRNGTIWFPNFSSSTAFGGVMALVAVIVVPALTLVLLPKPAANGLSVTDINSPECVECGIRKIPGPSVYDKPIFSKADSELHASYRISADQIAVSSALYCPQRPNSRLLQVGNVPQGKGWLTYDRVNYEIHEAAGVPFVEKVYRQGARYKTVWVSYYVNGEWLPTNREVKWASVLERLQKGVSAGAMLVISSPSYGKPEETRMTLEKLLSTFQPDSFLWEEIKPQAKGTAVCAE